MNIMTTKLCLILFFPLVVLQNNFVLADTTDNYEELRTHSAKIEASLKDWTNRAKAHEQDLNFSNHKQIVHWRSQMDSISFEDAYEGLHKLNSLINSDVVYRDDFSHFHLKDYWADPETTLEEGGDCEDIALLKAASLFRMKWPSKQMHLLFGYLTERGKLESHAVLLVESNTGDQFVLRSITNQVVLPDQFKFIPIYAVDGEGTIVVKPSHKQQISEHKIKQSQK